VEALQHSLRKGGARQLVESRFSLSEKRNKTNSESALLAGTGPFRAGA
jgi:hypothetical protein